jgi:hypothetical protein
VTNEWPSLLAPGDKIVPIIAFGRRFLIELLPKSSWLSQETSEILPSDGLIFYTDGSSVCESRSGAVVFSDTFILVFQNLFFPYNIFFFSKLRNLLYAQVTNFQFSTDITKYVHINF